MTPGQLSLLCTFSNLSLPPRIRGSLGAICPILLPRMSAEKQTLLRSIREDPLLSGLMLEDVVDKNADTGLVAYVFRDPASGHGYVAFRGSETEKNDTGIPVDWVDNLAAPFSCSAQYADAAALAARFRRTPVTFTGHSKGGHNALFALSTLNSDDSHALSFNAQGFARGQLSREQIRRLRERAQNLVVQKDPVGALLWHPERRRFVRYSGRGHAHSIAAFSFASDGQPVPGRRPLWSWLLEAASRLAVRALRPDGAPCPIPDI